MLLYQISTDEVKNLKRTSTVNKYYIAYYLVDDKTKMVIITRIFYGGRDIKGIINSNI